MDRRPPRLSVIVPLRDRSGARLANCLRSVRWQAIDPTEVEVILSDFGSAPEHARDIDALADRFGCRVQRTVTRRLWNRSRALNIGIRVATGTHVLCTDVDIIFAPNFFPVLLAAHERGSNRAFVVCRCHDLPPTLPLQPWDQRDFAWLRAQATLRETFGTGACQSATRAAFEQLRGYDEKYLFWGKEDTDMLVRAVRSGLDLTWIDGATQMLHQWHRKRQRDARLLSMLNRARFALTKHRLVKNSARWGTPTD